MLTYSVEFSTLDDAGDETIVVKDFAADFEKACSHARRVSRSKKVLAYVVASEETGRGAEAQIERVGAACFDLGRRISVEGRIR